VNEMSDKSKNTDIVMSRAIFEEMLEMHGADTARWSGFETFDCEAFLAQNTDLKEAYEQARALDSWLDTDKIETPDFNALQERILAQVSSQKIVPFTFKAHIASYRAPYAAAAMIVVFCAIVLNLWTPSAQDVGNQAVIDVAYSDIVSLEAEIMNVIEQEIVLAELSSTWRTMQVKPAPIQPQEGDPVENEIDQFLDNVFPEAPPSDEGLEQEMDLWDLFLQSENTET